MATFNIDLHKGQIPPFNCIMKDENITFVTVAAGRQGGKTHLVRTIIPLELSKTHTITGKKLNADNPVLYIAPSLKKAKELMWDPLVRIMREMNVLDRVIVKEGWIYHRNGRKVIFLGADDPDSLRGYSPSLVCVDEAKDIKHDALEESLLPTLNTTDGKIFLIGTPKGKGGLFYQYFKNGIDGVDGFKSFTFTSKDNPMHSPRILQVMKNTMPAHKYRQEYEACFDGAGGEYFNRDQFKILPADQFGAQTSGHPRYIAIDFAGFTEDEKNKRLDDHVIAVVVPTPKGWFVEDMIAGKWGARELSLHICRAYQQYQPIKIGGEVGALKNAIREPLADYSGKLGLYFNMEELRHGNTKKADRIVMNLLGRAEHGRLFLKKAAWNEKLIEQAIDFPAKSSHDDYLDALSYIAQLAVTDYSGGNIIDPADEWVPYDDVAGF